MTALPKLSYVLLSHNREKYIRRAIESAFAQDYEGELEYIFSDDCSTDGTYAIMQECVKAYKGNRRVILTQTPHNLHLAGNTNHALTFVESDWIVRADDDDYSTLDRCTVIGQAIAQHPDCKYVTHGFKHFTDNQDDEFYHLSSQKGRTPNVQFNILDARNAYQVVPSHNHHKESYNAWHMDIYRIFGDLKLDGYYVDDLCSYYRANILGKGIQIIGAPVHLIRCGSINMSRGGDDGSRGFKSIIRLEKFNDKYYNITLNPLRADLELFKRYVSEQEEGEQILLAPQIQEQEDMLKNREKLALFWRKGMLYRLSIMREQKSSSYFDWIRCLPMPIFALILACFRKLKH